MVLLTSRARLLGGAALGLGLSMVVASPAQASCVVTPAATPVAGTVVCGSTSTNNTTYAGVSPAIDRTYNVDTSTTAFTGTVSTGAVVDTNGLAFVNTVPGTNALNVVNNGSVSASTGVSALQVVATGATPVNYSGEGNITQTNVASGHGLDFFMQGTGNLVATVGAAGGATTTISSAAPNSAAIQVNRLLGTAGNVTITTTSDTTLRALFSGINIDASGAGTMTVTNAATIGSLTTAPNTLLVGIRVVENGTGTGAIAITNTGAIGSATDRIAAFGIGAQISNAASTAALGVSGTGAIFSSGTGIGVANFGTGTTTVNYTGAINTTGPTGVGVFGATGLATVTLGNVTAGTDAVRVNTSGAQAITLNGVTTGTAGSGLVSNTAGARTITVGAAGNVTGGTQAILLTNTGTATVTNGGIVGSGTAGLAVNAAAAGATTVTNNAAGTINGRLALSGFADTFTNAGIWNTQGITDFGAGADTLANTATGTVNLAGATTLTNLETFTNAGRINLNTFVLTGPAIAFTNTGTIDTNGSAGLAGFTRRQCHIQGNREACLVPVGLRCQGHSQAGSVRRRFP